MKQENKKEKFPELMEWFDFMNNQFKTIKENQEEIEINNLLKDNNIREV